MDGCPLIRRPDPARFAAALGLLQRRFDLYAATSPAPLPATGLVITPEIRYQSELYLPIAELQPLFFRYYRASLTYEPILSSSPFHTPASWADCCASLPIQFRFSANPGRLLQRLLSDRGMHEQFLYYSFLPGRFNGAGFGRYPVQLAWLRRWLVQTIAQRPAAGLRCLDAACGSGEGVWELVELAAASGWQPGQLVCSGWTLDPLEVYAAEQRYLPHAPLRQQAYRRRIAPLLETGWRDRVSFQVVNLLQELPHNNRFDLILCNGLLGGPIVHEQHRMAKVIRSLAELLQPGGLLLTDNSFHGGWHKRVSSGSLEQLFVQAGLDLISLDNGTAGCRSA